ncbi:MAG: hypothetical protein R3312_02960 [Gammaproteobacteria bacterium]|nr:hypothetical protein [Gammaproteobacteria bacterium]
MILAMGSVQVLEAAPEDRRQAKRMHDRLAGTPPSPAVLNDMESLISAGNETQAALNIMNGQGIYQSSAKHFYSTTVKNMVTPWTNEAQTVFAPLNDYTATVIGMVRDNVPFNSLLSADLIYVGSGVSGLPAYSMDNNNHYEFLEDQGADLSDTSVLISQSQSAVTGLPASATAGILTTRAAARAFFIDGTNRAMYRFTMLNHLCNDLEQIKDASRSPDRIQQDVTRSPGGDSRIFMTACQGCHTGMDPLNQAFAYYNYEYNGDMESGRLVYTPNSVQGKYLINSNNFETGYITTDDSWVNYWREGANSVLGWSPSLPGSGNGAKSMGQELANSDAFASCQVKKVFKSVCFREPSAAELTGVTASFKADYNLKNVFAEAAVACMGN